MPSLIGSAPNQVPTNGMLGTMAFQDADNASVATKAVTDNSTSPASTAFVSNAIATNGEILTTTGTVSAYSVTPTIPLSSYFDGYTLRIRIHTDNTGDCTLNVSGLGAKSLNYENSSANPETFTSGLLKTGQVLTVRYKTDRFIVDTKPTWSSGASTSTNDFNTVTPKALRMHLNALNAAPIYACRAWVNFNGTGTVAIRASGNVTSITDNGVGDYTVNFTTAMEDANYAVVFGAGQSSTTSDRGAIAGIPGTANGTTVYSTTAVRFTVTANSSTTLGANDCSIVNVAVFR